MRSSLDHAGDDPERAEGSPHPEPHRGMWRPVLTLLLLSSLTFFLGLGRQAITDSDEGFYAEAAREMVEGGDWLTPHFNYSERWQKPALYYWLTAATYLVLGPTELAARLWSSLSGIGLVLLTFMIARRIVPEPEGLTPGPRSRSLRRTVPGVHEAWGKDPAYTACLKTGWVYATIPPGWRQRSSPPVSGALQWPAWRYRICPWRFS